MAQRRSPPDALDYFPTPPWAVRALCEWLERYYDREQLKSWSVEEPACGEGYMARALAEYFGEVIASDIFDYGYGEVRDFLPTPLFPKPVRKRTHWIVTNPPFVKAVDFVMEAFERDPFVGIAMLLRTSWLEGGERFERLFKERRPAVWLQYAERVPMTQDKLDPDASTATAYGWAIWLPRAGLNSTSLDWIAPCRDRLERPADYMVAHGQGLLSGL